MKKVLFGAALTLAAAFNAQAADAASPVRFLLGAGLTFGGDKLATVQFSDGSTEDIKGGGLVQLYGGVEFRLGDQVSAQATVGYHVDDTSGASNGSVRFSRIPVDLLLLYRVNDKVRLGGGVQLANSPEVKGSGVASNIHLEFENATGAIIEGEYLFTPQVGMKVRYVSEKFKVKNSNVEADGNHLGLLFSYYF